MKVARITMESSWPGMRVSARLPNMPVRAGRSGKADRSSLGRFMDGLPGCARGLLPRRRRMPDWGDTLKLTDRKTGRSVLRAEHEHQSLRHAALVRQWQPHGVGARPAEDSR